MTMRISPIALPGPSARPPTTNCAIFDFDHDGDVDLARFFAVPDGLRQPAPIIVWQERWSRTASRHVKLEKPGYPPAGLNGKRSRRALPACLLSAPRICLESERKQRMRTAVPLASVLVLLTQGGGATFADGVWTTLSYPGETVTAAYGVDGDCHRAGSHRPLSARLGPSDISLTAFRPQCPAPAL